MSDARDKAAPDRHLSQAIGHLLRVGVLVSGAVVLVGAVFYLLHQGGGIADYSVFTPEPHVLHDPGAFLAGIAALRGRDIIQLGLLLLIMTPVLYVVVALEGFRRERDWLYVGVSSVVLAVLLFSLFFVR